MPEGIRIGVIGCDVIKRELEKVVANDPDVVHKEYLEYGLHIYPDDLKQKVIEKVNSLQGKVDAVLLGYAICQSLRGITEIVKVPSVMLEGDDCIATILTPQGYEAEKRKCVGTWFSSPGWAEVGIDGAVKELHLDSMVQEGYDPMFFMKMMFEGYQRVLFIDTDVGEKERFESLSRDFADRLELRYEERGASLHLFEKALQSTKALARKAVAKRLEGMATDMASAK
ncbi:MAG: hypothetical protein A4E32_00696 [Methanomassiliicoccales archaeon PtaU1.Bin124]|nr:MAG: hypothetical protein A4E32_00696 [Methanomassiliicoccales archaeon PtaU1.Bin124]